MAAGSDIHPTALTPIAKGCLKSTLAAAEESMMQEIIRLSLSLSGAAALALAAMPQVIAGPAEVAQGTAEDLGVMSISLKDVVKPTLDFQGALQGAGTPNQAGIGGFLPFSVGDNNVWFVASGMTY